MSSRVSRRSVLVAGLFMAWSAIPLTLAAQVTGTVRGRVLDAATGRPAATAQVYVQGTGRGAVANERGDYLITAVPVGTRVVRVELIGYGGEQREATVAVNDTAVVNFEIEAAAIGLDEVVVTGVLGGTQKRAIGNVVTRVRAEETVKLAPVANVQQLLNARAPGVVIMPGTGQVGSSAKIRIRGASSLALSNEPLIYVDGIRVDNTQFTGSGQNSRLNDFNPDDIESIEIIKGPSAATLYGTEAANGVIQIITKKGRIGTPTFGVTARWGTNEFANYEERIPTNYWRNPATNQVETLNLATAERERGTPLFETGVSQNYNVNVSGGTEAFRYYVSTGYDREQGVEPNNFVRRFNGKVNITVFPKDGWDVTASTSWIKSRQSGATEGTGGGRTWGSFFSTPQNLTENLPAGSPPRRGYRSFTAEYYDEGQDFQNLGRYTGSLAINHRPTSWLSHRLTVGIDEVRQADEAWREKTPLYLQFSPTGLGSASSSRNDRSFTTVDYSAAVRRELNQAISSETAAGLQFYNRQTASASASGTDFALPGLTAVSATADRNSSASSSEETSVGVFAQQQLGWNGRVFVTAAIRADDHSAFGQDFTLVYYPKASATWVISEESFFNLPAVSSLRLRGAWGASGQQPSTFAALRTYTSTVGPGDLATVTPSSPGNPSLGPQRASEVEAGFDAGLFNERVLFEFTYYNTTIKDDILSRGAPPSEGFPGTQFLNLGRSKKWGVETLVSGRIFNTNRVSLESTFSLATNRSKILDLGEGVSTLGEGTFGVEHRLQHELGSWFHVKILEAQLDSAGRHIRTSMVCEGNDGEGVPCFTGNTITAPRVYLGRTLPRWEGAFSSTLRLFDNITVYGLVDFKLGHSKWDHNLRIRCSLNNICRENIFPLEYDPVTIAAYQNGANFGDAYIKDASFGKLREVSVAYALPSNVAARVGATRATISFAGRNLMTWTKYEGMEVEAMFLGGGFVMQEQNQMPLFRQLIVTTTLTF